MEIQRRVLKDGAVRWRVRWRQGGRVQTFDRKGDAVTFGAELRRRQQLGTLTEAIEAAGLPHGRPYRLRHSFASLLLHEGLSVIYVARQLGHDARLTLSTYGHVMDEFEDMPRLDAQTAIADARAALAAAASSS